ncbi:hypothetical protein C7C46_24300 [Streptomyces tateyamensis]|uniref:Uncharacterized protein n=1 Tax=Streptomyces tateyamensis TaxID=565073 RepID=A0A2V4N3S8_9ACTN|nr:hypothetical protein [Streptomyces tateyamensis]PYC74110.1 hypothetical protein C7C46_24300 [Streptomyces tateyamensis]
MTTAPPPAGATPPAPASSPTPPPAGPPAFLGLRTAVILVAATVVGLVAGTLTFFSTRSPAGAVLAGLTAFGASVLGLHQLIARTAD